MNYNPPNEEALKSSICNNNWKGSRPRMEEPCVLARVAAPGHDDDDDDNDRASNPKHTRVLFKKHLRQMNQLRKHETRMQQAAVRNDTALEARARRDWEELAEALRRDPSSVWNFRSTTNHRDRNGSRCLQLCQKSMYRHVHSVPRSMEERDTPRVQAGSQTLLAFRQALVPELLRCEEGSGEQSSDEAASLSKERQTRHAAALKGHMQHGTQTLAMFRDRLALLGYTRQKFHERSVLAFCALDRLDPSYEEDEDDADNGSPPESSTDDRGMRRAIWKRLMETLQVVSIGCGPGCDALGALAFLDAHGVPAPPSLVLWDFAVEAWQSTVLDRLVGRIVPRWASRARLQACDVREAALGPEHAAALASSGGGKLVVVSYLLTETRHAWEGFFRSLLETLQGSGSLLLLMEPMAWQLHEFLRAFGSHQDGKPSLIEAHVWLDSSRDLSHLQDLDGRNGPAILLVCPW